MLEKSMFFTLLKVFSQTFFTFSFETDIKWFVLGKVPVLCTLLWC